MHKEGQQEENRFWKLAQVKITCTLCGELACKTQIMAADISHGVLAPEAAGTHGLAGCTQVVDEVVTFHRYFQRFARLHRSGATLKAAYVYFLPDLVKA